MDLKGDKFKRPEGDSGDVMLPFMSLLLIIIPVLISNVAFYHFKSINVNIPGTSPPSEEKQEEKKDKKKPEDKFILQLTINEEDMNLDLINESTGETITKETITSNDQDVKEVWKKVIDFRNKHKKIDSIMVSVGNNIKYDKMVTIFEKVVTPEEGSEIDKKLMLVLMPKGIGEDG